MGAGHGLQSMFSAGAVMMGLHDELSGLPSTVSASPPSTLEAGDLGMTTGDNAAAGAAEQASASVTTDGDDETPAADSETVSMATSSSSAGMSFVTSH